MGLLSIFKRKPGGPASTPGTAASEPVDAVQRARVLARQRLIGAVILVIVGVIGFPLVFETQPRPIPVDIPIEVPRKESAPPLAMPPRSAATASAAGAVGADPKLGDGVITETAADAGRELPAPTAAATQPEDRAASKPAAPPLAKPPVSSPPAKPPAAELPARPAVATASTTRPDARAADATRARELLAGKSPADAKADAADSRPAAAGRFVLQVGAFADATAAHEVRVKAEKLGLKTYTQVANTSAGSRIRVRVGPFGSRDEADRALAKARGAGLSAVVLTL